MKKIKPLDIIKTTKDISAKIIIKRERPYLEVIDIILPKGSLLFCNTNNYNEVTEFSFVPFLQQQFETIKNLYLHKITLCSKILGYSYIINAKDLQNNFETEITFYYKQLQTRFLSHIYLLTYLYLDGKIQEVGASIYLCFISDWKPLEEAKINYDNSKIPHQEALTIIAHHIEEQIKLRKQ